MTVSDAEELLRRVIQEALVNESIADQQMAVELLGAEAADSLPAFKQLKLAAWQSRLGSWFRPAFGLAQIGFPIWLGFVWIRLLAQAVARKRISPMPAVGYFDFFESHLGQIEALPAAPAGDPDGGLAEPVAAWSERQVVASLGIRRSLQLIKTHAAIVWWLRSGRSGASAPHLLYSHNAMQLLVAGAFVLANQSSTYVTANTLQHRAYVLSWLAPHCWIAQHGVLRTTYEFPHSFHDVERIYLLHESSADDFEVYYSTPDFRLLPPAITFEENPLGERVVLLGSSAPFIDQEIAFCKALRAASDVPLCIKLHPYNLYDERKDHLIEMADLVVDQTADLACAVFVSVSSTYAVHYEQAGIATVSLENGGVAEVIACLDGMTATSN